MALWFGIFVVIPILLWRSYHFVNWNTTIYTPYRADDVAQRGIQFGSGRGFRITNRSEGTVLVETEPKINWALMLFLFFFCGWRTTG